MAALQCEICGGKLMAKAGGLFECEYCGMQYDKTRIQEMVQEIKGTVKVEGTVQVAGTVKLDGPVKVEGAANKENLVKLAKMQMESIDSWETNKGNSAEYRKIEALLNQALSLDPEYAEAYLYLACLKHHAHTVEEFCEQYVKIQAKSPEFDRFFQFAQGERAVLAKEIRQAFDRRAQEIEQEKQQKLEEKRQAQELEQKHRAELRAVLQEKRETMKLAGKMIACGQKHVVALKSDGTVIAVGDNSAGQCNVSGWRDIVAIYAGPWFTVGMKTNGSVVAVGRNSEGQCNVRDWRDITSISVSTSHVVGLKSDGTVAATGYNKYGECNVGSWRDIVAVYAGAGFTLGLKSNGTVTAVGMKDDNTFAANDWHDIVGIRIVDYSVIGLRSDGTVVVAGSLLREQPGLQKWKDIIVIDSATHARGMKVSAFTLGVRSDGTVLAAGDYKEEDEWTEILTASAYGFYTVGLKQDGTVEAESYSQYAPRGMEKWQDIVAISTSDHCIAGLKSDGRVVIAGSIEGKETVGNWRLFQSIDNLKQDLQEAEEYRKKECVARKAALERERITLHAELANLKGFFTGKRRKEIEAQLSEIETKLKGLE